jgi:predicted transposase/invertase (TIGR01784 family)
MERTIISFDYAMKTILRDKANFDILSGFLSELLARDVVVQEILESEGNTDGLAAKVNRVDLKAKIDNGEIAVFEIQFADQADFLGKVIFNACKAIVEQVSRGDYYDIKKVYSINIAYFNLEAKREYLFRARLSGFTGVHYDEHIPFSQHLNPPTDTSGGIHPEYYLILPLKFNEEIRSRFDEWVYVLKTSRVRSSFTAAGVQEAGEKLDVLKMTPEEKTVYEKTRASEMDYKSQLYTAEMKGRMEILELLKSGKSPEEIIKSYDANV